MTSETNTETTTPRHQVFPPLDPATEAALRASIQRFGVLVPVVRDQHGDILDGHHRSRIAEELGLAYPEEAIAWETEEDLRELLLALNEVRRHLTMTQRRSVVKQLRAEGHSTRAIAGAVGVNQSTVVRDLEADDQTPATAPDADASPDAASDTEAAAPAPAAPAKVTGTDGKSYPAKRKDKAAPAAEAKPEKPKTKTAIKREVTVARQMVTDVAKQCGAITAWSEDVMPERIAALPEAQRQKWATELKQARTVLNRVLKALA